VHGGIPVDGHSRVAQFFVPVSYIHALDVSEEYTMVIFAGCNQRSDPAFIVSGRVMCLSLRVRIGMIRTHLGVS
jgi:hypothetical protein